MLKAGLVDEFRILIYPFTFGEGKYIFEHMGVNTLKLLETKKFNSGTVALHYQAQLTEQFHSKQVWARDACVSTGRWWSEAVDQVRCSGGTFEMFEGLAG